MYKQRTPSKCCRAKQKSERSVLITKQTELNQVTRRKTSSAGTSIMILGAVTVLAEQCGLILCIKCWGRNACFGIYKRADINMRN